MTDEPNEIEVNGTRYVRLDRIWRFAEKGDEFIDDGLVFPTDEGAPDECCVHYMNAVSVLTHRKAYHKSDIAWIIAEAARTGQVPVLPGKGCV